MESKRLRKFPGRVAAVLLCALPALALFGMAAPGGLATDTRPEAAPGLRIPASAVLPYVLDSVAGQPELVPLRRSYVQWNHHAAANMGGRLAGSFLYKPKETAELEGAAAAVNLHTRRPKFYYRLNERPGPVQEQDSNVTGWAIVTAKVEKSTRVLAEIRFTQITGHAKRSNSLVETTDQTLEGGWHVLEPKDDLPDGQYAMAPMLAGTDTYATSVFAFAVNLGAAENADVVKAGAVR